MDNPERNESNPELSNWIEQSSVLLAPPADWEPDIRAARALYDARLQRWSRQKRYLLVGIATALLACIVVPAVAPARVFAQQIGNHGWYRLEQVWYWFTIVRVGPAMFLPRGLPAEVKSFRTHPLIEPGAPQSVSDPAEAERRAGFVPRLPHSEMLSGRPRLSVTGPQSFGTVIRTADVEQALRNAQVADQDVPRNWDGARLVLQLGVSVTAEWYRVPDEWSGAIAWDNLTLVQGPPPRVVVPTGFDLAAFTEVNLRTARMRNRESIRLFAQRSTTAPALLMGGGTRKVLGVRGVNVQGGPATLIEDFGDLGDGNWIGPKVDRIALLWSAPDRVYVLIGTMSVPCPMSGIDLAAAVTNAIDLANAID